MAQHNDFGKAGEVIAKHYLETLGYQILNQNWTFGKCEVDIIAIKDKKIIFAEVKTRSSNLFGEPETFVNMLKQRLMQRAADEYIHRNNFTGEIRFDIISILFDKQGNHKLRHIEDAFWPQF